MVEVVEVVDIVVVLVILMVVDDVREDCADCVDDDRTYLGTGIDVVMEESSSPMSGVSVTEPEEDVVVNQFDHHESSVVVSSTDTTSRSDIMSDGFKELRSSNVTGQASLSSALLSLMRKLSFSRLGSMSGSMGSLENIMSSLVFAPYSSPISGAIVVSLE